jgi:hypothetical protein
MGFATFAGWTKFNSPSAATSHNPGAPSGVVNGDAVIQCCLLGTTTTTGNNPSMSADWTLVNTPITTSINLYIWSATHSATLDYTVTTGSNSRSPVIINGYSHTTGTFTWGDVGGHVTTSGTTVSLTGITTPASDVTLIDFAIVVDTIANALATGPTGWTNVAGDTTASTGTGACQGWAWTQNVASGATVADTNATFTNADRLTAYTVKVAFVAGSSSTAHLLALTGAGS